MTQDFIMILRMAQQFNSYELFISGIFHICSDRGSPWVTETVGSKTMDNWGLLYPLPAYSYYL